MGLLDDSVYSSTDPKDLQHTYQIELATLICSSASMAASIVVFYWFYRMQKLFRHRS
jgi:hypothetical protein